MKLENAARWLAIAAAAVAAVWNTGTARAAEATPTVHIYTWSDYFDSEVLRDFEKQAGCRIEVDYFDSNEAMYAKLKAGGGGYDIITPSSYMSAIMRRQDMLLPLDHGKLPNLKHIDRNFTRHTEDAEMAYGVPYTRTVTGVGYNARRVKEEDLGSWDIFSRAAYAQRMTMLNDMRESIGAALKYLGHSINTADEGELAAAGDVISGASLLMQLKRWPSSLRPSVWAGCPLMRTPPCEVPWGSGPGRIGLFSLRRSAQ